MARKRNEEPAVDSALLSGWAKQAIVVAEQLGIEKTRWVGRSFNAEKFDAKQATRAMKKGLPDWRNTTR